MIERIIAIKFLEMPESASPTVAKKSVFVVVAFATVDEAGVVVPTPETELVAFLTGSVFPRSMNGMTLLPVPFEVTPVPSFPVTGVTSGSVCVPTYDVEILFVVEGAGVFEVFEFVPPFELAPVTLTVRLTVVVLP